MYVNDHKESDFPLFPPVLTEQEIAECGSSMRRYFQKLKRHVKTKKGLPGNFCHNVQHSISTPPKIFSSPPFQPLLKTKK